MSSLLKIALLWFCLNSAAVAGTFVNTIGSDSGVAISGFDTVAFHTEQKAVKGSDAFKWEWNQATWYFSNEANRDLFKADPAKFAPEYGGHCALGMSEGYVSPKPTNGVFELYRGKLYLFPPDTKGNQTAVKDTWWRRGGPNGRIHWADQNWPKLKAELEAKQP